VDTDLAPDALPTTSDGRFDPAGGGAVILANTPLMGPGATTDTFRIELEAGKYVFISNEVGADGMGDYGKGMRTGFTVE
jgi:hypothetical protein